MVDIRTICVGDYLQTPNGNKKIKTVFSESVVFEDNSQYSTDDLFGIPLTVCQLKCNRFKEHHLDGEVNGDVFYRREFKNRDRVMASIALHEGKCNSGFIWKVDGVFVTRIYYVHELQHLLRKFNINDNFVFPSINTLANAVVENVRQNSDSLTWNTVRKVFLKGVNVGRRLEDDMGIDELMTEILE